MSEAFGARRIDGAVCCICTRTAAMCRDEEGGLLFSGVVQVASGARDPDKWICRPCGRGVTAAWVRAIAAGLL